MKKINSVLLSLGIIAMGIIVLFLCVYLLPILAQEAAAVHPEVAYLQYPILLGLYATAIPFFYALYESLNMIYVIERKSLFSSSIIKGLNYIKYCAFIIIALYVAGFIILDTANAFPPIMALAGLVIIIVSLMVATGSVFIKNVLLKFPLSN
ncbi:DUF2975 domain-containing protein [Solibacillus merdavium]|uniref:DUF2975 domain-containing protein n=1 Tax=Solibacillus merdavium TaxID=2762218 RepID=A0ABR8XPV7_9BACL|nr:DUF2975 domain-containing protein [Solibacillus merdavium]MBD8033961.1 DUF2975 domain-containing protein [Solibacillus merdavium]